MAVTSTLLQLTEALNSVKNQIEAKGASATPEELAYLGSALEKITGATTLLDLVAVGQVKQGELNASTVKALADIQTTASDALSAMQTGVTGILNQSNVDVTAIRATLNDLVASTSSSINNSVATAVASMESSRDDAIAALEAKRAEIATEVGEFTTALTAESVFISSQL